MTNRYKILDDFSSVDQTGTTVTSGRPWNGCLHPHRHLFGSYTLPFAVLAFPPMWSMMRRDVITIDGCLRVNHMPSALSLEAGAVGHSGSTPRRQSWMMISAGRRAVNGGNGELVRACRRSMSPSIGRSIRWITKPLSSHEIHRRSPW